MPFSIDQGTLGASQNSRALFEEGTKALEAGRPGVAIQNFIAAIQMKSDYADAYFMLGVTYISTKQLQKAINALQKALEFKLENAEVYERLAFSLYEEGLYQETVKVCDQGVGIDASDPRFYLLKGASSMELGNMAQAEACLEKAVELCPKDSVMWTKLGSVYLDSGKRLEARKALEKATKLEPKNAEAHRMLSLVRDYKDAEDEHILEMQEILAQEKDDHMVCIHVNYGLGKANENLGDYKNAFLYYEKANNAVKEQSSYSVDMTKMFFEQIKQTFTPEFVEQHKESGLADRTPIFIFGMPRSGTSLVEQVLASHPSVYGAGELVFWGREPARKWNLNAKTYVEQFHSLSLIQFKDMAQSYLATIRKLSVYEECITDKMPLNFRFVGLMKLLFPNAAFIHCTRDPVDTCMSMYKLFFLGGLPFSYDLKDLGGYYNCYRDLMSYWHELFPGGVLDVCYEDVIGDQEGMTRKLLDHCNLPWDEACLQFHKNKRAVKTASSMQVNQPIYKTSVQAWKHYEPYIGPLLDALEGY